MDLEFLTTLLVVAVFIAAEIYRVRGGRRGVILRLQAGKEGEVPLAWGATAVVKLEDGDEITAEIQACTLCLGRLGAGDEVRVLRSGKGYSVDLPWFRATNCARRSRERDPRTANSGCPS